MNEYKLNGESKDILAENISKLKDIFPEIVTEDKIDFDKLKLILGENVETDRERYNFTWPGKTQAIKESQKQSTGTLRPCKEESKNWDTTQNLYIEGDNLEVLKLLQKTYYNKIKMIYIDPPYNTGNDFIYPDNYKDNIENYLEITGQSSKLIGGGFSKLSTNTETDGRYHSNWLNMMYPRLKLAKNLLTDDGVIFISIDDNEEGNLKKMCDEIFGEDNFIANLIRRTRKGGGSMSKYISSDHDYILVYTRKISSLNRFLVPYNKDYLKRYNEEDEKSKFFWDTFARNRQGSSNNYTITAPDGQKLKKAWIYKKDKYEQLLKEGEIRFKKLNNSWSVQIKQRINKGQIMRSILNDFINKKGTKTINDLLGNEIFTYTKPVELTEYFLNLTKNDDIILDFFSGSGTTAHSVLKSNLEKNKHNNFILIQIPEPTDEKSEAYKAGYKNICEIGKERIRRAGDKILEESDNKDLDIGFKVFKLDSSNLQKWDPDYKNLTESLDNYVDNIKTDRTEEDLVYEIMLKYGIDLTLPIQKENTENHTIYSVGHGALLICLDDNITKDITKPIIDLGKDSISTRVVFKDNGFKSDSDKTNIKETLKVNNIKEFITI